MTSVNNLEPKRNRLILAVLEVLLITIGTLMLLSVIQLLCRIWNPNLNLPTTSLIITILIGIASAVSAYFLLGNLPGRQTIIQKLTEEKGRIEQQLDHITQKFVISMEQLHHETAKKARVERALNESELKLKGVINKAPIGIALLDKEGIIMDCNPAFQAMLGYRSDELIGVRFPQAVHPDDTASNRERFRELLEGKSNLYRLEHR